MSMKKEKTIWVLITVAVAVVAAAILFGSIQSFYHAGKGTHRHAELDGDGNLHFSIKDLSEKDVSFIRAPGSNKIELLARLDKTGAARIALGTCQSCNGSPQAYYIQQNNLLICNNCGQTFSLDVINTPGGGCRPMALPDGVLSFTGDEAVIRADALPAMEKLFTNVEEH